MTDGDGRRRGSTRLRILLILIFIALLLYALRELGIPLTYETDDTEVIDPYRD